MWVTLKTKSGIRILIKNNFVTLLGDSFLVTCYAACRKFGNHCVRHLQKFKTCALKNVSMYFSKKLYTGQKARSGRPEKVYVKEPIEFISN